MSVPQPATMELNQPRCTPFFLSYRLLVKHNHRTGRVLQLLRVKSHWCQKPWSNKLEHIPCKNGSILHYPKPWWYNMRCDTPYWYHGDGCWQEETLPRSEQAAKVGHHWIITTKPNKTQNVEGLRPTNTDICFWPIKKNSMQQHLQQYSSNALLCLVGEICLSYFNSRPPVLV